MAQLYDKSRFALFFGNRGFFPGSLIAAARDEMTRVLNKLGHETIALDGQATRYGAVETLAEAAVYANFLKANAGKLDGVILSLPNFGDENGAVAALKDAGVPILIQAFPDDLDKMAPDLRRDSFCGKLSIMDVFYQNEIPFTALKPHTVLPSAPTFASQIDYFDRVCRVVNGLKKMTIGAVGARTTPFKTVRFDELALQRAGITVETFDLTDLFAMIAKVEESSAAYCSKADKLKSTADFSGVPAEALTKIVQLGVALDELVDEWKLDAVAIRCWTEMQSQLGISPCVVMGEMNDRGVPAACEVDVGNAVAMYALSKASGDVPACLDWNNNYADNENKCILFHCGPVPRSMMAAAGTVQRHAILEGAIEKGCSFGCNVGRIKPTPFTFSSMMTEYGCLRFYVGEGKFTADRIADDFFGCAGVAEIDGLQDVLLHVGKNGHRHHVSVTPGHVMAPLREALESYLGFEATAPQREEWVTLDEEAKGG